MTGPEQPNEQAQDGGQTATVGVDPDAPRPTHLGFRIHIPEDWYTLDLDPATSNASIDAYINQCLAARPAPPAYRAQMRRILRTAVTQHRANGVFLCSFLAGHRGRPDDVVGASLTLAFWQLEGGAHFDVDGMAQALAATPPDSGENPDDRIAITVDLPAGPAAYLHTSQLLKLPDGKGRQRVSLTQFFVPTPDLTWCATLTTSTPNLDIAVVIDGVAEAVASSLEWRDGAGQPIPRP